jgi:hypothetical protein
MVNGDSVNLVDRNGLRPCNVRYYRQADILGHAYLEWPGGTHALGYCSVHFEERSRQGAGKGKTYEAGWQRKAKTDWYFEYRESKTGKLGAGVSEGKCCISATCADIYNCLRTKMSSYEGARYLIVGADCRSRSKATALACCLKPDARPHWQNTSTINWHRYGHDHPEPPEYAPERPLPPDEP